MNYKKVYAKTEGRRLGVSVCPDTQRTFLCFSELDDNIAEVFNHCTGRRKTRAAALAHAHNTFPKVLEALSKAVALLENSNYAQHHCQCPLDVDGPIGSKGCICVDLIAPFRAVIAEASEVKL